MHIRMWTHLSRLDRGLALSQLRWSTALANQCCMQAVAHGDGLRDLARQPRPVMTVRYYAAVPGHPFRGRRAAFSSQHVVARSTQVPDSRLLGAYPHITFLHSLLENSTTLSPSPCFQKHALDSSSALAGRGASSSRRGGLCSSAWRLNWGFTLHI